MKNEDFYNLLYKIKFDNYVAIDYFILRVKDEF